MLLVTYCAAQSASLRESLERTSNSSISNSKSSPDDKIGAGPRGVLLRPADGKVVKSNGKMGVFTVEYKKVESNSTDEAVTISVDLGLVPKLGGASFRVKLTSIDLSTYNISKRC